VGVLADGAFAASIVPMIVYLPGRCIAVRRTKGRDRGRTRQTCSANCL